MGLCRTSNHFLNHDLQLVRKNAWMFGSINARMELVPVAFTSWCQKGRTRERGRAFICFSISRNFLSAAIFALGRIAFSCFRVFIDVVLFSPERYAFACVSP